MWRLSWDQLWKWGGARVESSQSLGGWRSLTPREAGSHTVHRVGDVVWVCADSQQCGAVCRDGNNWDHFGAPCTRKLISLCVRAAVPQLDASVFRRRGVFHENATRRRPDGSDLLTAHQYRNTTISRSDVGELQRHCDFRQRVSYPNTMQLLLIGRSWRSMGVCDGAERCVFLAYSEKVFKNRALILQRLLLKMISHREVEMALFCVGFWPLGRAVHFVRCCSRDVVVVN